MGRMDEEQYYRLIDEAVKHPVKRISPYLMNEPLADPRLPEALFGMAETYRYMGRKSDAVENYEKFLQVRPTGDDAAAARNLITQLKE